MAGPTANQNSTCDALAKKGGKWFWIGTVLVAFVLAACSKARGPRRPDVVLVIVDTLRADAIGNPDRPAATPALEALAEEGVRFTRALAHAPMTLPSHTSLFASRHPFETGVLNNHQAVPENLPLLQAWMQEQGYETRAVISMGTMWHPPERPGLSRGFDDYDMDWKSVMHNTDAREVNVRVRASLAKRDSDRPLFLFVHYCDPHDPYLARGTKQVDARVTLDGSPIGTVSLSDSALWIHETKLDEGQHVVEIEGDEEFHLRRAEVFFRGARLEPQGLAGNAFKARPTARFTIDVPPGKRGTAELHLWLSDHVTEEEAARRYDLEVAHVDRCVGELLQDLKSRGLYDDSLILFSSDHGEALGEGGLLGHVENLSDSLIKVPLIIKLPADDPRAEFLGQQADTIVPLLDLAPTILEVVGLPDMPGQNGSSLLQSRQPLHIAETHGPEARRNMISLRDDTYKLVFFADENRFEMYEMQRDPREEHDVFSEYGNRRKPWREQLRSIAELAESGAVFTPVDAETQRILDSLGYGGHK